MRATIRRRLPCPGSSSSSSTTFINASTKHALIPFSTSSGGGRGRGRGGPTQFDFSVPPPASGRPLPSDTNVHSPEAGAPPFGHGRGRPIPSAPILPSFSSFISSTGRGRPPSTSPTADSDGPKKPIFFRKDSDPPEWAPPTATVTESAATEPQGGSHDLPTSILSVISGAGRGKPLSKVDLDDAPVKEPNRHLKARPHPAQESRPSEGMKRETRLPRDGPGPDGRDGRGRGRGFQARGRGRGRGRGYGWAGPGRGFRQREQRGRFVDDQDDEPGGGLYLGDDDDDEKLARRVGPEVMEKLAEGFEEASLNALPSPAHDVYLDAFHTNCLIEFEPEYLMADFETNPDIDEKPPIPLRDALEKMKPFLMLYEGIKSQEEWDEVMKETMDKAPLIKEIVDYYSGPDRVTAKKQQEELERVAKTLPKSAPASVKEFTNRAVISLQSNPGWGFDKKCQFMDKLVWEVSQQYK